MNKCRGKEDAGTEVANYEEKCGRDAEARQVNDEEGESTGCGGDEEDDEDCTTIGGRELIFVFITG